ncbi:hypothetical protein BKP35_08390 [Anaerobacillus arseniciselenatis]|uniref:DUF3006 domain-containing protein n=2 Tax=Anaerobacillus arseniciselenatis TaxID=85682 RepID=A0A1S2LMN4_9BACI|nr:hypothetical protein BKP35_08390 [Anaerobacillus arseniciselenatis]
MLDIMKAVIDRFVDGELAVLLVGEEEKEYNVPIKDLPQGAKEGSIVNVTITDGTIVALQLLLEETNAQQNRMNEKLNQLKSRKRSNFKRN